MLSERVLRMYGVGWYSASVGLVDPLDAFADRLRLPRSTPRLPVASSSSKPARVTKNVSKVFFPHHFAIN